MLNQAEAPHEAQHVNTATSNAAHTEILQKLRDQEAIVQSLLREIDEIREGKWDDRLNRNESEIDVNMRRVQEDAIIVPPPPSLPPPLPPPPTQRQQSLVEAPLKPSPSPTLPVALAPSSQPINTGQPLVTQSQQKQVKSPVIIPMDLDKTENTIVMERHHTGVSVHVQEDIIISSNAASGTRNSVKESVVVESEVLMPPRREDKTRSPVASRIMATITTEQVSTLSSASPSKSPAVAPTQSKTSATAHPPPKATSTKKFIDGDGDVMMDVDDIPSEVSTKQEKQSVSDDNHQDDLQSIVPQDSNLEESERHRKAEEKRKNFRRNCNIIWGRLADHRVGNAFQRTYKEDKDPEYFEMIKKPLNLSVIKNRFREGDISSMDEFHRDILQMLANAIMYHDEDTEWPEMCQTMRRFTAQEMSTMMDAQAWIGEEEDLEA